MTAFDATSRDGTRIAAYDTGGPGPVVLLCNGLGASLSAWPQLVSSGYRVVGWDYRGLGGSARPADRRRITVEDHVADAVAVLDSVGVSSALVASWSVGVNVAFELALLHPARVTGLLGVAGVPGGTFSAMFGPLRRGPRLRHAASLSVARGLRGLGPVVGRVARATPLTRTTAAVVRHTAMARTATPDVLLPVLADFRAHDFRWYFTLAVAIAEHPPMDLSFVRCPVTLVSGRRDIITSRHDLARAAARIPHARLVELDGTHFLPIERPAEITALLGELVSGRSTP